MNDTDERPNSEDEDIALLKRHVAILSEHFDSVHIFATRHLGDEGTISCQEGCGNWFARKGQITEWVLKQDEGTRLEVKKAQSEDD